MNSTAVTSPHQPVSQSVSLDALYPYGYSRAMFTIRQTEEFVAWLDALKDKRAQVRIAARLRQAEVGSLGDWQPIEGEVSDIKPPSSLCSLPPEGASQHLRAAGRY